MSLMSLRLTTVFTLGIGLVGALWAGEPADAAEAHDVVIRRVAQMTNDEQAQALAKAHGLDIVNVLWEDTGRAANSALGPNISDVTIEVHGPVRDSVGTLVPGVVGLTAMPVLRHPNFTDVTADLPIEKITLLVGNERGEALRPVGLAEVLSDLRRFLRTPETWRGEGRSLLAERDTHVLVSAQATFLPIPAHSTATFNPIIYNYQSAPFDPAVLVLLVTANGTSITVIDPRWANDDDWGSQRLYHHADGQRANLVGRRLSERLAAEAQAIGPTEAAQLPQAGPAAGLNLLMIIQVPLRQWTVWEDAEAVGSLDGFALFGGAVPEIAADIEAAALEVGALEGPFTEIGGLEIERDARFPIRVTVQFYQATSNGVLDAASVASLAGQIRRVYDDADFVGSLVTNARADRPTRSHGPLDVQDLTWYPGFWRRWEQRAGHSRDQVEERLLRLLGPDWRPPAQEAAFELMVKGLTVDLDARRRWRADHWEGAETEAEWLTFWQDSEAMPAASVPESLPESAPESAPEQPPEQP